jgi:hypothetical protein
MKITQIELEDIFKKSDDLVLSNDFTGLEKHLKEITSNQYEFDSTFVEAQFYYAIGNCYSSLHHPNRSKWYSSDQTKIAISYRKSLAKINSLESSPITNQLKSMVSTNLANHLSSQGRALCCIELYDNAIRINNNPVAYVAKARNELFIAESIYDGGHRGYHYYVASTLLDELKQFEKNLEVEQRIPIESGGILYNFKQWFDESFDVNSFDYFKEYKREFKSGEQKVYLRWCGDKRLFLNDLNDVCVQEIVYQDILGLSSFTQGLNPFLNETDQLVYHGNYDEIKNDFCYARYLMHQASLQEHESQHFFNQTFPHVETGCGVLDNLKVSHYKSAFKILYSLFDKIAYFIHRYFDLNDISKDAQINIDKLFKKLNKSKSWQPNDKLDDGKNFFINALFFILQDIRNVAGHESISEWVDPDSQKFSNIRNAIEHRSLIVVDAEIYDLVLKYNADVDFQNELFDKKLHELMEELEKVGKAIGNSRKEKNDVALKSFQEQREILIKECSEIKEQKYEKQKLSTHTLHISIDEFELRLFTLIKLVRNSIMYLSLAINLDSKFKDQDRDGITLPREIPLRG